MSGFIAMQRGALEHPLFRGSPDRFYAWFWLVARAAWKATPYDINGKTVTLQRGEVCVSRSQLATAWGWSPSAVERFLTRLETEQMIGRATGQGRTVISICNYAKYQDLRDETEQATGQATGQRPDSDRTAKEPLNHLTIEEPKGSNNPLPPKPKKKEPIFKLPEWVPVDEWNGYVAMRIAIKKPMTERAKELVIGRLANLGPHFGRVLDQSTRKNWMDVYALKDENNGGRNNDGNANSDGGIEPPYNPYLRSAVEWEARQADQFE